MGPRSEKKGTTVERGAVASVHRGRMTYWMNVSLDLLIERSAGDHVVDEEGGGSGRASMRSST